MLCCRFSTCGAFRPATSRRPSSLSWASAPNTPAVITRRTAEWQTDYEAWQKRDLSTRRYVYVWADGVYLHARMHAGADRRDTRGQEGTRRLPDRGARKRAELA